MRGKDLLGIVNLLIVAGVVAGISYAAMVLRPAEYDPDTLCLAGETPPHTVVVIDKTDLYTLSQAERIGGVILGARDRLAVGERLSLYELDESGRLVNTNRFSLCNPGRGEQINPLYRNPARVQARYQAKFEEPLQRVLRDLLEPRNAPASPILEALARLAETEGFDRRTPGRRVHLVSDMLQNSELFSVYGRARGPLSERLPAPSSVAARIEARYGRALAGVEIDVIVIPREGWREEQAGVLIDYWSAVFRALGAEARFRSL